MVKDIFVISVLFVIGASRAMTSTIQVNQIMMQRNTLRPLITIEYLDKNIKSGMSEADVVNLFGKPDGKSYANGGTKILDYFLSDGDIARNGKHKLAGFCIYLKENQVVKWLPINISESEK